MKRIVLILLALMMLLTSTGMAQAAPVYGFIPLISKADGNNIIWQSVDAYQEIQPRIAWLTNKGVILDHKPLFASGIVAVKYHPGADLSALGTVYSDVNDALATIQYPSSEVGAASFAPFFTISAGLQISATGLGADAVVEIKVLDGNGVLLGSDEGSADPSGNISNYLSTALFYFFLTGQLPQKFSYEFNVYDSTKTTLMGTYKITLPINKMTKVNLPDAVMGGKGLPNKTFTIQIGEHQTDNGVAEPMISTTATSNSKGVWVKDFGKNLMGGRTAALIIDVNANFQSIEIAMIPFMSCTINTASLRYCQTVTLKNYSSRISRIRKGNLRQFSPNDTTSVFNVAKYFTYTNIPLITGDVVSDPPGRIPATKAPKLSLTIDAATDTLAVKGPANSLVNLYYYDDYASTTVVDVFVATDASGAYSGSAGFDAKSGETYIFSMTWVSQKTGAVFTRYIVVQP